MRRLSFYYLLIVLCIFGCNDRTDYKTIREKETRNASNDIIVGAVASWQLEKEEYIWQALQLAVDNINSQGGIRGRKIQIVKEDDEGSLDKGLIIAEKFSSNTNMLAVLGHSYSYISIPCSILYQFNGLMLISPTSDNPELSNRNGYSYIFQLGPNSDDYVNNFLDFLETTNLNRIIIFNQNDVFGSHFADYFEKIASGKGLNIITRIPYSESAPEIFFRNKLLACKYFYDFNAILIAADASSAIPLIGYCHKYDMHMPLLGTEHFDTKDLIGKVMETKERIIFPSCFDASSESGEAKEFINAFKSKFGFIPRSSAAKWYNAMQFLAYAMRQTKELTPAEIIKTIHKIKEWNGTIGKTFFDNRTEFAVINNNIVINTISEDGRIIRYKEQASLSEKIGSNEIPEK